MPVDISKYSGITGIGNPGKIAREMYGAQKDKKPKSEWVLVRSLDKEELKDSTKTGLLAVLDLEGEISPKISNMIEEKRLEFFEIIENGTVSDDKKLDEGKLFCALVSPEPEMSKIEGGSSVTFRKIQQIKKA